MSRRLPTPPMEILIESANRSGCQKSQRGAVILPDGNGIVGTGWNRPLASLCDGSEACRRDCPRICIHAEQDALLRSGRYAYEGELFHLKTVNGQPVPSGAPSCAECSKLMLSAGVAGVWLLQENGWRRWTAEEFHRDTLATLELYAPAPPPAAVPEGCHGK